METLFVKYSNVERDENYRIKTEIIKENGEKKVLKQALNEESQKHINDIYYNYGKLKKAKFKLNLAKCYLKEKKIYFEYIDGNRLDTIVMKIFFENGKEKFFEKLKEIREIIDENWNEQIVNLDLTLDNMIMNKEGIITVIDYEWIYEGKIEKNFVFYRLLEVLYTKYGAYFSSKFSFEELLEKFNLAEKEILELKKLNADFYKEKLTKKVNLSMKKHEFLNKEEYLQVYYDYGNGFDESKSLRYDYNYENEIRLEMPIKEGVKSIRIDPKNKALNLKIKSSIFRGLDGKEQQIDFESNAVYNDEKNYVFTTEDPQMYFRDLTEGSIILIFKEAELEELLEDSLKIVDKKDFLERQEYLQVYYDYGKGFDESKSLKYDYNYKKEIKLEIPIKEGIKLLRIDPKNKALNLKIKNSTFRGIDGNEQEIDFESNAIYNDKKYYIFTTEDPQIYFKDLSEGLLVLKFKEVELGEMLENAIKITDKAEFLDKEEYLQIYYDYGDGFSEENSSKYEYNYLKEIELEIPIKEGIKSLRIDPKNEALNLEMMKSSFKRNNKEKILNFETNAVYNNENYYIFTTEDPQIYFKDLSKGTLNLMFKEIELEEIFKK
jgi:hypothetical protein